MANIVTLGHETTGSRAGRREPLHRLHALHRGVPGRRHRRRPGAHAYGGRRLVHRLRAVPSRVPGRLHRHGGAARALDRDAEACRRPARPRAKEENEEWPGDLPKRRRAQAHPGRHPRPQASMNPKKRHEIFSRLRQANPNPTSELEYGTAFELLVAVVLSAQATDKSVNLATRKLFPIT